MAFIDAIPSNTIPPRFYTVAGGQMWSLRHLRAMPIGPWAGYHLMAQHVRKALADHVKEGPEHFLSLLVLDTAHRAPPLDAVMSALLHADPKEPPTLAYSHRAGGLAVFAQQAGPRISAIIADMVPLLSDGVRIDYGHAPRVAAFLAMIATHVAPLKALVMETLAGLPFHHRHAA